MAFRTTLTAFATSADFEEQALYNTPRVSVGEKGSVEQLAGDVRDSLRLLRVPPLLGRAFSEEEGTPGKERQVVLSNALWQRLYAGQDSALGKDLRINGNPGHRGGCDAA